jgi:hypothetical protein
VSIAITLIAGIFFFARIKHQPAGNPGDPAASLTIGVHRAPVAVGFFCTSRSKISSGTAASFCQRGD